MPVAASTSLNVSCVRGPVLRALHLSFILEIAMHPCFVGE